MEFPQYLTELIERKDMYKAELARRIKKTRPYIYQLCSGKRLTPKPKPMAVIAKALDADKAETQKLMDYSYKRVLGEEATNYRGKEIEVTLPPPPTDEIPILSWASAVHIAEGKDASEIKSVEGRISSDLKNEGLFALKVKHSFMEPIFSRGDIITVDPDAKWKSSDYIVVRFTHDDEATFKQIKISAEKVILHHLSDAGLYPDIKLTKKEFDKRVAVIGKVVECRKRF